MRRAIFLLLLAIVPASARGADPALTDTHWFRWATDGARRFPYFDLNENAQYDPPSEARLDRQLEAGDASSRVCWLAGVGWIVDAAGTCTAYDPILDTLLSWVPDVVDAGWFNLDGLSLTCGVQEAITALDAAGRGAKIRVAPEPECPGLAAPIHYVGSRSLTLEGIGSGSLPVVNTGTRFQPIGTSEFSANSVAITVEKDICTGFDMDIADVSTSSFRVTDVTGAGCDFTTFKQDAFLRLDNVANNGGGAANDQGGPYRILAVEDGNNLLLGDPKNRITAASLGSGDERIWSTTIDRSSGTWEAVDPIDTIDGAEGDTPWAARFRTDAANANTCPFANANNCEMNLLHWLILGRLEGNTRLAIDDTNEIAVDESVTADYVISWSGLIYAGESVLGTSTASVQMRTFRIDGITFDCDGDGDLDGDVANGILMRADNDHAGSQKNIRITDSKGWNCGAGPALDPTAQLDHSYADVWLNLAGQQDFSGAPALPITNDQLAEIIIDGVEVQESSGCIRTSSRQTVNFDARRLECANFSVNGIDCMAGLLTFTNFNGSTSTSGMLDPADNYFYMHSTCFGITTTGHYLEMGAGKALTAEASATGFDGSFTVIAGRSYNQELDKAEPEFDFQSSGHISFDNHLFERADETWDFDIDAPNAQSFTNSAPQYRCAGSVACDNSLGAVNAPWNTQPRDWNHATDCTALTAGRQGDRCIETDRAVVPAAATFICIPTAGDICDTAGEWEGPL